MEPLIHIILTPSHSPRSASQMTIRFVAILIDTALENSGQTLFLN